MKKKIIISSLLLILVVVGLSLLYINYKDNKLANEIDNLSVPTEQSSALKSYTANELAVHNSRGDCWVAIDNKVYNITAFIDLHPGGEKILQGCGKDSTQLFNSISDHAKDSVQAIKNKFFIGELAR